MRLMRCGLPVRRTLVLPFLCAGICQSWRDGCRRRPAACSRCAAPPAGGVNRRAPPAGQRGGGRGGRGRGRGADSGDDALFHAPSPTARRFPRSTRRQARKRRRH